VQLYDTARRAVVPFEPGHLVTMYTCGITPYDATHVGHAATYVLYDVLQRRLRDLGHETQCVRNVTDVDDDILRKAREVGVPYLDLAAAEVARFQGDMRALNMLPAFSEPAWESMWGPGRPGWHIECSALALRELGTTIDLHGGGSDLIFPHHECEAAQSEAATGERFVRHWLHAPMVEYEGTKMSKSLGNLVFVSELVKDWEPMAIRLAILDHSYREPWTWHDGLLEEATARLERWRAAGDGAASVEEVRVALDDDLDLPRALRAIDDAARAKRGVRQAAELIGVVLP
jgi:cysteinyl-tRNA synthetase